MNPQLPQPHEPAPGQPEPPEESERLESVSARTNDTSAEVYDPATVVDMQNHFDRLGKDRATKVKTERWKAEEAERVQQRAIDQPGAALVRDELARLREQRLANARKDVDRATDSD